MRNGSGTYQLPAGNPVVTGTAISSSVQNTTMTDVANALTTSICTDGQTPMAANLSMSGFRLTGLGGMVSPGDSARYEDLAAAGQAQTFTYYTTAGTAPAFTLTPTPALLGYVGGQRFNIMFNATGTTGSNTLAVSALAAKNLKQYDPNGVKQPAYIPINLISDVIYDGTDMVLLNPATFAPWPIQPVTGTVAANALTLGLNPTVLSFRSTTLTIGVPNVRTVSTALSLIVPSGATLGTISTVQSRLILLAIDNAGTIELAVVNVLGGNNLDETTLISTTAITAGATSASIIYSTTARTSVAFRVVGYVESTQATAGTWATAPSTVQGYGGQAVAAMSSFGFGQTEQNFTGTKVGSTTYYNTTGRTIFINVFAGLTLANANLAGYINGVMIYQGSQAVSGAGYSMLTFPVRTGCSYAVFPSSSTIATAITWYELR